MMRCLLVCIFCALVTGGGSRPAENPRQAAPGLEKPVPGRRTLRNFLLTALQPAGKTLYVWGGGWNAEDTGAGREALSVGVSPQWARFYAAHGADYDYKNFRYQIHDGLDCSGLVGWAVFNTLHRENADTPERLAACTPPGGKIPGYVGKSTETARQYADAGFGTFTPAAAVKDWRPGDIMSMRGHVWIAIGACPDGSVVVLHSSPPGVRLCGTLLPNGARSMAVELAETYMRKYFSGFFARYPACDKPANYLTASAQMRWHAAVLSDPDGLATADAATVLRNLLGER